uniref:Uncharacterized protein n=1 Tax=Arundo donax TaxID=35708 RepID=A0A0A8ZAB0_ARUDO
MDRNQLLLRACQRHACIRRRAETTNVRARCTGLDLD